MKKIYTELNGERILKVVGVAPVDCYRLFAEEQVDYMNVSELDVSNVESMDSMFEECKAERIEGLYTWNTEKCTDFNSMFENCNNLSELDLSSFNTAKSEYFAYMFCGCNNLQAIYCSEKFDTSNGKYYDSMFCGCESLLAVYDLTLTISNMSEIGDIFENCRLVRF